VAETVAVLVDGQEIQFELPAGEASSLTAATGDGMVEKASTSFEAAISKFGAMASKFAEVFEGRRVSTAEISLGLKITAKGDFIVVGSSGEATLNLKLVLTPK
jgi:hypothetical protein